MEGNDPLMMMTMDFEQRQDPQWTAPTIFDLDDPAYSAGPDFMDLSQEDNNAGVQATSSDQPEQNILVEKDPTPKVEQPEMDILTDTDAEKAKRTDSKSASRATTPRDGAASPRVKRELTPSGGRKTPPAPAPAPARDPKDLLSPRKPKALPEDFATVSSDDEEEGQSIGQLLLNAHNVQDRKDAGTKRRNITIGDFDTESRKKPKMEIKGGSGVITEFFEGEKSKEIHDLTDTKSLADAIDLTDEPDTAGPDIPEPVQYIDNDPASDWNQKIVLLGELVSEKGVLPDIHLELVPRIKPNAMFKSSATHWPPVHFRLIHDAHFLFKAVDWNRAMFGKLDFRYAKPLAVMLHDHSNFGISMRCHLVKRPRSGEDEGEQTAGQARAIIKLFAKRYHARWIGKFLRSEKILLRSCASGLNDELYNPHDPPTMLRSRRTAMGLSEEVSGVNRTVEELRADVMNMFDAIIRTEQLPEAPQPKHIKTELLSHQKQGLFFLTEREKDRVIPVKDSEPFSLWKKAFSSNGQAFYTNVITGTQIKSPPSLYGGILADMMGLGKTLSMLSLVVSSLDEAEKFATRRPAFVQGQRILQRNAKTTLLVCPLSVMANWQIQIEDHVKRNLLSVYLYHGTNRTQDLEELSEHDIIITSYQTIASEMRRLNNGYCNGLFYMNWFRIILDEAHIIRNADSGMSRAACELSAQRRWCVTGTPVQNRLDDLGALIKFLRIKPFDDQKAFSQYILTPFKTADPEILPKLRLLVDSITLRRMKDNIDLPGRIDNLVRLEFSDEELKLYRFFVEHAQEHMKIMARNNMSGKSYAQILKSIMKLRQICAHGEEMLHDDDRKLLEGRSKDKAIDLTADDDEEVEAIPQISQKQAFDMLELLRHSSQDYCVSCNKQITNKPAWDEDDEETRADTNTIAHLTSDYHLICPECWPAHESAIQEWIAAQTEEAIANGVEPENVHIVEYQCEYCDANTKLAHYPLKQSELDAEAAEKARIRANPKLAKTLGTYRGPHTKTKELVRMLKEFEAESHGLPHDAPIKSVVFSAWTSHLDLIQIALTANNINYTRLDGTMSRKNRATAIKDFTNDPDVRAILITIGAGGLGLNLTAASKVFMMEPQFNPAAEAQAVDRVHRLGQTREVQITRFIMDKSFEENMISQQKKKIELADLTINRNRKMDKAEAAKAKLESLKSLFK